MANTIIIDGTNYTDSVRFPDGFSVTYAIDDSSKTVNVGISSGIVFERDAFNYLQSIFFPTPFDAGAKDREANVRIINSVCNEVYNFIIRADAVTYCPQECIIEAEGFERSDDFLASGRLRSLRLSQVFGFAGEPPQPKMRFCIEFGFGQALLVALITPLVLILQAINSALQFLGIGGFTGAITNIQNYMYGCNNHVNVFYIKDLLEKDLASIGLTLQSSIFQSSFYSNAVWVDPDEGDIEDDQNITGTCQMGTILISKFTVFQFLEILSDVFNADYRIKDGVLIFERRDFFLTTTEILVNADLAYTQNLAENAPCYQYTDQAKYANGLFEYTKDAIESVGNNALSTYYRDRVEWNDPFDINKSGTFEVLAPIGAPRFAGDGFSPVIDNGRPSGLLLLDRQATRTRQLPKIIVIQGQDAGDVLFCEAKAVVSNGEYNNPMWFREGSNELYDNFWSIEDPRTTPNEPYELQDFEFCATCDQIRQVRNNGIDILVESQLGKGTPQEIVIDYEKHTITIKNTKLAQ